MPFAVLKNIRECSSEDEVHCSSNLLQNDPSKRWKTAKIGEKSAYIVIEMESPYTIRGIDIGNECSSFIEVLVGGPRCTPENFKEILITSSFMTPTESRDCLVANRVRCFGREALVREVAREKWQLLKIVCTQPFNPALKYGLSFIRVHVDELPKKEQPKSLGNTNTKSVANTHSISVSNTNTTVNSNPKTSFTLRGDSPDSESESTTSLFNRWKSSKNKGFDITSSVPRNITPGVLKKPNESFNLKKTSTIATPQAKINANEDRPEVHDRNRNSLLFTDDDDENEVPDKRKKRLEKLEMAIAADQDRVTKETEKNRKPKKVEVLKVELIKPKTNNEIVENEKPAKNPRSAKKTTPPSTSTQRRPSSSPCFSDKPKKLKLDKHYKPFNRLLEGVVLVISGIQNPDRADLRNKALALGAKYKGDWDSSSTHLICAFENTPKYNQVKGVGKIVTRSWIEDCHSQRKKIPWRRYALDSSELTKPESEDEILDESLRPPQDNSPRGSTHSYDDLEIMYDVADPSQFIQSGSDTEDEIEKFLAKKSPNKKKSQTRDVFEVSTEEEDYVSNGTNSVIRDKTRFYRKYKFFLSDQLSATDRIKLERYIETYSGVVTPAIKEAHYLIANTRITDVGEFKGETVTPVWVFECNDAECLLPTKRYLAK